MQITPQIRRQKFRIGLELVQSAIAAKSSVEIGEDGVRRVAKVDVADGVDDTPAQKKLRIEVKDELVDPSSDFAKDFAIPLGTAGGLYHQRPLSTKKGPEPAAQVNEVTPSQRDIESLATTVAEEWPFEEVSPGSVAALLTGAKEPAFAPRKTPAAVPRVPMTLPEDE